MRASCRRWAAVKAAQRRKSPLSATPSHSAWSPPDTPAVERESSGTFRYRIEDSSDVTSIEKWAAPRRPMGKKLSGPFESRAKAATVRVGWQDPDSFNVRTRDETEHSPSQQSIAERFAQREEPLPSPLPMSNSQTSWSPPERSGIQIGRSDSNAIFRAQDTVSHFPVRISFMRPKTTIAERFRQEASRLLGSSTALKEEVATPAIHKTNYVQPYERTSRTVGATEHEYFPVLSWEAPPINYFTISHRADALRRRVGVEERSHASTSTHRRKSGSSPVHSTVAELIPLLEVCMQGDYMEMNTCYEILCELIAKKRANDPTWTRGDRGKALGGELARMMKMIVESGNGSVATVASRDIDDHVADFRSGFVLRIFDDLQEIFGVKVRSEHGVYALAALAQLRSYPPRRLIRQHLDFVKRIPGYATRGEGWLMVMGRCQRAGIDDAWMRRLVWRLMLRLNVPINSTLLEIYLRGLPGDDSAANFGRARDMLLHPRPDVSLQPMTKHSAGVLAAYLRLLCEHQRPAMKKVAREIREELLSVLRAAPSRDNALALCNMVADVAKEEGMEAAFKLVEEFKNAKLLLAPEAVCTTLLTQHLSEQAERQGGRHVMGMKEAHVWLEGLERVTGAKCSDGIYSVLLTAMVGQYPSDDASAPSPLGPRKRFDFHERGGPRVTVKPPSQDGWARLDSMGPIRFDGSKDALDFYRRHRKHVSFSVESLHALLLGYVYTGYPDLKELMELYRTVCDALPLENTRRWHSRRRTLPMPPQLYEWLFKLCHRSKDVKTARELHDNMQSAGSILSPKARKNLISTLLLHCSSFEEAFKAYNKLRAEAPPHTQPFTVKGWVNLFLTFIWFRAAHDVNAPLPANKIIDMLIDMRQWGCAEAPVYVILLSYLARTASRLHSSALNEQYRGAVMEIHRLLLAEETDRVPQSLRTITALINAYNHLGLDQVAIDIWQRLRTSSLSSRIEPATMAVVFDTCGFSGRLSEAQYAFQWAIADQERSDKLMSMNVWDAWIECQARCGAVHEALNTLLYEMVPALEQRQKRMALKYKPAPPEKKSEQLLAAEDALRSAQEVQPEMFTWQRDAKDTRPDSKLIGKLLLFCANSRDSRDPSKSYGESDLWWQLREVVRDKYPDIWPKIKHVGILGFKNRVK